MRKLIALTVTIMLATSVGLSKTHTITNSGFTFVPSSITITLGDTVVFSIESIHQAREVSQATWNANGNTSNGGFETPFGGGIVVLKQTGIHYYVCVPHASLGMKGTITVNSATGVNDRKSDSPAAYALEQNYPNPFNPSTTINFELAQAAHISLKVYNILGEEVATLVDGIKQPGSHKVTFSASNLPTGVYLYRLVSDAGFVETRKMVLVK